MTLYAYDADGNRVVKPSAPVEFAKVGPVGVVGRFAHATTTGTLLEIVPGVEVYSASRKDFAERPKGGVVLEKHAGASGVDDEGEIIERPAWFTVWDRQALPGQKVQRIEEPEVDLTTAAPGRNLGLVVREMASELAVYRQARGKRVRGSAYLSGHELDLCRWIGALGVVIAGGLLDRVEVATPRRRDEEGEF